jgi:hypothetical protein
MKFNISRTDVWAAALEDRPGSLADKLTALGQAGANLEFIIARRTTEKPGKGVVFVTPVKGAKALKAAKAAGFAKAESLHSLRLEGTDKPGLGAKLSRALAEAGFNLHGLSGAVLGRNFVAYVSFDTAEEATRAAGILKKLG